MKKVKKINDEAEKEALYERISWDNYNRKKQADNVNAISRESLLRNFLIEYKDFFIKDIDKYQIKTKSKNSNKQMIEFVKYVFNKFSVPAFMNEAWEIKESNLRKIERGEVPEIRKENSQYKDWYICLAQGHSLYKKYFKNFLTKKETHIFTTCKYELKIKQVLIYAIAKAESDNDGIALRIARSRISEKDMGVEFWRNVVRFFAQNPPKGVDDVNDLLDYLSHKKLEDTNYSIFGQGFTLESLTKKMNEWHRDLRRMKIIGNEYWEGFPLEDKIYQDKDNYGNQVQWRLKQIKSSKELQAEGNAQRHCVFSYKSGCLNGRLSIWSLLFIDNFGKENRKLTIELNDSDEIVQARGLANRKARSNEANILAKWAKDERLRLRF